MTAHARALDIARKEIGVHEVPMGKNTGPRVEQYQGADWIPGGGYAWCVSFVQWCWKQAGHPLPYPTAGAYDLLKWARKNGWATKKPVPGDAVILNVGSGHCAMFERFDGNLVHTIDGNSSDQVKANVWPRSAVRGYVHIKVEGEEKVKPPKPPLWEVVTSESGHSKVLFTARDRFEIAKKLPGFLGKANGVTIRRRKTPVEAPPAGGTTTGPKATKATEKVT